MAKPKLQNKGKQAPARRPDGTLLPGGTANPGGRPKAGVAFREEAQKAVRVGEAEGLLIIRAWVKEVQTGGEDWAKASELLAAYAFGKPPQGLELSGPDGAPISTTKLDVSKLSDKDARALRELLAKAATQ